MPELPEVEVLRRSLIPHLVGVRVESIRVADSRLREPVRPEVLHDLVEGRSIRRLDRRAKYLLVDLEGDATMAIHLGMSGRLTVAPLDAPTEKHEHVAFGLSSGSRLRFRDPRRFGLVFAIASEELAGDRHFRHLGREPLDQDFSGEDLAVAAARRRGPVKGFLMNGSIVVGVGNIYVCEVLHLARVHPRRSVARISKRTWGRIASAIKSVLASAIEQGGTTLNDFANGEGEAGYFQVALSVYGRAGEACGRCGRTIKRIVQSGRGTFFCPGCQR